MSSWRAWDRHRLVVGLLLALLTLIVCANGLGQFHTDIKPEVYIAPADMIGRYLSSWTSSPYLGSANFNVGLVPVLVVLAALRGIGLSPEWSFKVFHLALWVLAAGGVHRLVRQIAPRAGRWGGTAAAVVYLANPYTIQAGATLAIALPMAFLPWQLLCLVRALREPRSWAWPAGFGLSFFAMSGMNVAVVPVLQLLAVIPVVWAVRDRFGTSWRDIGVVLGRCALFVIGVSIYWLIPGLGAQQAGSRIIGNSESLTGIAKVSSFPEVLRGVGLWPLYGSDHNGPWVPQHAVYVAQPLVMVLTMAWPVLGLLALRWTRGAVRLALAGMILVAAVVMVGLFPSEDAPVSPLGYLLRRVLQEPTASVFRTTNKIGAVLALALAVSIGIAAARVLPRLWRRPGAPPIVVTVVGVLLLAWSLPAVSGRLYTSAMDIPQYWEQAAAAADRGDPASTTLFVPGQVRPNYRWTVERPDDLPNSLMRRDAVIPETTPNASPPGANFLAALDNTVQSGQAPAATVSDFARYLGSDRVLVRNDIVWENQGGARPAQVDALVSRDPGLFGAANFGRPGENILDPDGQARRYGETNLPPVQLYDVKSPRPAARAQSATGSLLVAGDGFAFPAMSEAGLLKSAPTVRYAQDLDATGLASALSDVGRLVLTDTNARRDVIANRLTAGQGPLLPAAEKLGNSRTLGLRPADQTVLLRSGPRTRASTAGGVFFDLPYGAPEFALDRDPRTAWRFGDFGRAVGQTLTITLAQPLELGKIPISQLPIGVTKLDRVTVRAGGRSAQVRLPDQGSAQADLGGVRARQLTLTVDSIRGGGYNLVGVSEIGLPGPAAALVARTPVTFTERYQRLSAADRARFDRTPMSLLLTRAANTADINDDSEPVFRRVVSLPRARTFQGTAMVRASGAVDQVYDAVAGFGLTVRATSSRSYFDAPQYRASQAADNSPQTAWVPGGRTRGSWWQVSTAARALDAVTIEQQVRPGANSTRATRVRITVDGRLVASGAIGVGTSRIALPKGTRGSTVRVSIDGVDGPENGRPPRFTTIDTGARMSTTLPRKVDRPGKPRCQVVASLNAQAIWMRPTTTTLAARTAAGTPWQTCEPVTIGTGQQRIDQAAGFQVDSINLSDGPTTRAVGAAPSFRVVRSTATERTLQVESATGPYAVLAGTSIDPRWRAQADGRDLGPPILLDGFSAGWLIPDARAHTITMKFTPQTRTSIALGVGTVIVLFCAVLLLWPFVRRRRAAVQRADDPPAAAADGADQAPEDDAGGPDRQEWHEQPVGAALAAEEVNPFHRHREREQTTHRLPRGTGGGNLGAAWAGQSVVEPMEPVGSVASTGPVADREPSPPWTGNPGASPERRRWPRGVSWLVFVLIAAVVLGPVGAGVAIVVLLLQWVRPLAPDTLLMIGAGMVLLSMPVYLVALGSTRGEVSADGVAASLVPHYLAGAGLLVALAATAMMARREPRRSGRTDCEGTP